MPSYTFTLNVETKIAEARLRAFRATAEKELSSIQQATSNASTGGGGGRRGGISGGGGGSSGGYGSGSVVVGQGSGLKEIERFRAAQAAAEVEAAAAAAKQEAELRKFTLMRLEAEEMYQAEVRKGGLAQTNALKMYEAEIRKIGLLQLEAEQMHQAEVRQTGLMRLNAEQMYEAEIRKSGLMRLEAEQMYQAEVRQTGLMQLEAQKMNQQFNAGQLDGQGLPTQKASKWSNLDHVLKTGFLAYGTYLAASQAITGLYDFGKVGAQQERTAQTFEQLAERIGVSADGMRAAVQKASHGTIDEMTGMGLSAQVLAQNFAGSLDDIEGDTEILIRAARRFSQVYTDENGQNLSTQAIYARLIKFSREGNKELVDQFGLSNELIANLLNIPNQGLRGAEGAENRWKGMIMALELELKKLGEATGTPADRIEAAEARWTKAVDNMRTAAIEPVTVTVEFAGNFLEQNIKSFDFYRDRLPGNDISNKFSSLPPTMGQGQPSFWNKIFGGGAAGQEKGAYPNIAAGQKIEDTFKRMSLSFQALPLLEYTEEMENLDAAVQNFLKTWELIGQLSDKGRLDPTEVAAARQKWETQAASFMVADNVTDPFLAGLAAWSAQLEKTLHPTGSAVEREDFGYLNPEYARQQAARRDIQVRVAQIQHAQDVVAGTASVGSLSEAERDYRMAVGGAAERLAILQAAVDNAKYGTDEYWKALLSLAGEMDAIRGEIRSKVGDIKQWQLDMRLVGATPFSKLSIMQQYGGEGIKPGSPEERAYQLEIANLQQSVIEENKRLGEEAQREWKQTAKDVEQMFESAADKLMGIPGVTSLTPVTEQEMLDTRYGVYSNKADEWMRRVRDEVMDFTRDTRTDENGVTTETLRPRVTRDYSDVSREQVEKLTGMAAGTPHDVMIPRLERMWESGSLFADKNNLGLMNMDSIRASFEEMKQGATGRQNQRQYIMEQLGVSMSDASLITGTQAPIVQMMTGGQSEEEITAQLGPVANTLRSAAMASLTSGTGFMAEISAGWKKDIDENITKLDPLGDMIGKRLRDRINTTIGGLGLIDGIVARVIAELADGGV